CALPRNPTPNPHLGPATRGCRFLGWCCCRRPDQLRALPGSSPRSLVCCMTANSPAAAGRGWHGCCSTTESLLVKWLVHLRTELDPGTLVPVGWIAVGDSPVIATERLSVMSRQADGSAVPARCPGA